MLGHVLYCLQHLLQVGRGEQSINATITEQEVTASDSQDHEPAWASWSNEKLLTLPMSQLGVTLDGAFLSAQIQQLYAELEARQLLFRPHLWLSNEWFTPDGVPGIAVPFYLAHPRLAKLALDQLLAGEGGAPAWSRGPAAGWKMPIVSAGSAGGNKSLGAPPSPIPNITAPGPIVAASCGIS